jgi:hypothetical protein
MLMTVVASSILAVQRSGHADRLAAVHCLQSEYRVVVGSFPSLPSTRSCEEQRWSRWLLEGSMRESVRDDVTM